MSKRLLTLVVVLVLSMIGALTASANASDPGGTFTDDNGSIFEGAIEAIAAVGITRGCNPPANTKYCPRNVVTRGAMAAFLVRTLGLVDDGGKDWFTDDNGHLFENDINKLAAAGVTKGCNPPANDQFCPDNPVTRGAMAAFLVRGFGYTDGVGDDLFTDDDSSVFENDIDKLARAGVTKGCNPPANDHFCPTDVVVRDTMAAFLARAKGLAETPPPQVATFGPGTYVVGTDFPAGIYRNSGFSAGCYWERLSGFSGDFADIIANEFTNVNQIVEIAPSDAGFHADTECGNWTNQLVDDRQGSPSAPFGPGTYRVGEEISPGTWSSTPKAGDSCYWERRSGFSGAFADIIANDFTDTASIVEVMETDVGFLSEDGCGTWTKIG
jgi:hypothetical protein